MQGAYPQSIVYPVLNQLKFVQFRKVKDIPKVQLDIDICISLYFNQIPSQCKTTHLFNSKSKQLDCTFLGLQLMIAVSFYSHPKAVKSICILTTLLLVNAMLCNIRYAA